MTLPQLAALLGFNEKTARRDTVSLLSKLLAGFGQVDTEDPGVYALTIRVLIECPDFRKSVEHSNNAERAAIPGTTAPFGAVRRARQVVPRRFGSKT